MQKDIHPKYYPNCQVSCACGHQFTTGSTLPKIEVAICSACHPFFTGAQKFVDTKGRVDKFLQKVAQGQAHAAQKAKKSKTAKNKKQK